MVIYVKTSKNGKTYIKLIQQKCVIPDIKIIPKNSNFDLQCLKMTNLPVLNFYEIFTNCRKYIMLANCKIFLRHYNWKLVFFPEQSNFVIKV